MPASELRHSPWLGRIEGSELRSLEGVRTAPRERRKGTAVTRILLDSTLRSKLQDLTQPFELCDESGRVLGRFIPLLNSPPGHGVEPHLTEQELQRREQEPDYSTAEVLAHLEKL